MSVVEIKEQKRKCSVDAFLAVDDVDSAILFADALANEEAHVIDDFSSACLGFYKYLFFKLSFPKEKYPPTQLVNDMTAFECLCVDILEDTYSGNKAYIFNDDWDTANSKLLKSNFSKDEVEHLVALSLGGIYSIQSCMNGNLPNLTISNKVIAQLRSKYGHLKNNLSVKEKTS